MIKRWNERVRTLYFDILQWSASSRINAVIFMILSAAALCACLYFFSRGGGYPGPIR